MRLSDIMSAANLSFYAEVGLVIFFMAFAFVGIHVLRKSAGSWERTRRLPLEDERIVTPRDEVDEGAPS